MEPLDLMCVLCMPCMQVPPSGQRFRMPPEILKVRVEDGKIKEIVALKGEHSGPLALYKELAKLAQMPQRQ